MKTLLFLSTMIWMSICANAQQISGKVQDEKEQPIEFANVALYSLPDSVLVGGGVTNAAGEFSLQKGNENAYYLKVSFMGYATQMVAAGKHALVMLKPDAQMMGEVSVVASRPSYKLQGGSLVAQVKNTSLSKLRSANDVLSQLPFLSSEDGKITVFGKGTPIIYINNRLVRDNKELEQLSPANIKDIQVITSPGAEYDAEVSAVIKIVTVRPVGEGWSGKMDFSIDVSHYASLYENIELNYRKKAWDFFGEFWAGQDHNKNYTAAIQELQYIDGLRKQNYDVYTDYKRKNWTGVLGVNFNPNPNHSAGIKYQRRSYDKDGDVNIHILQTGKNINEIIRQISKDEEDGSKDYWNAYYNGRFSSKLSMKFNADVVSGGTTTNQNSTRSNADKLHTRNFQDYEVYAGKTVFSYQIGQGRISAGGEYSKTKMEQRYDISDQSLGIDNVGNKSDQNRGALFADFATQWKKWGLEAGMRYENISLDYYINGKLSKEQSRQYKEFFPNLSLSYAGEKFQTSLSYRKGISYPSYNSLSSNVQYLSPFLYQSGNPQLQPMKFDMFTWMFTKGGFQLMSSFVARKDAITNMIYYFQDKPILLQKSENIKHNNVWSVSASYNTKIGWWSPRWEVGFQASHWDYPIELNVKNKPFFGFSWSNTFMFPQDWVLRFNVNGRTRGRNGFIYANEQIGMNLYLTKSWGKSWTANVAVYNLFALRQHKAEGVYDKIYFYNSTKQYMEGNISITYRFNATGKKYRGQQATDELNRL